MTALRLILMTGLLSVGVVQSAQVQEPEKSARPELVQLVPPDVSLCLIVDEVRGLDEKAIDPRWIEAVRELPFGKALGDAPELMRMEVLKGYLRNQLGLEWLDLRDTIKANGVALAYKTGPAGEESGLLVIHAQDPKVFSALIERLTANDGAAKSIEHQGLTYLSRRGGKGAKFLFLDGNNLAVSNQESMIKAVVECRANPKYLPPVGLRRTTEPGPRTLASVWLNPRQFEEPITAQAEKLGNGPEGLALKKFLSYWKALDGVSLAYRIERGPELAILLHSKADRLPPAARKVVQDAIHPSNCWARMPSDSIALAAGQSDFKSLMETIDDLTPGGEAGLINLLQKSIGLPLPQDMLKSMALNLGPDWGFFVTPGNSKIDFPHVVFAVKVQGETQNVLNAMRSATELKVADYNKGNKDQVEIRKQENKRGDVYSLVNDERYPKGFRPSFSIRDDYLVMASDPEAIEKFRSQGAMIAQGPVKKVQPMVSPTAKLANKQPGVQPVITTQLVRISCLKLADLMNERHNAMVDVLSKQRAKGEKDAEMRFQALAATLELFNQIEIVQQTQGDDVTWILKVQTRPNRE